MELIDRIKILSAYNVSKFPKLGPFLSKDNFQTQMIQLGQMVNKFINEYDLEDLDELDLLVQMYLYICDPQNVNENYHRVLDTKKVKFPLFEFDLQDFTDFANKALEFVP